MFYWSLPSWSECRIQSPETLSDWPIHGALHNTAQPSRLTAHCLLTTKYVTLELGQEGELNWRIFSDQTETKNQKYTVVYSSCREVGMLLSGNQFCNSGFVTVATWTPLEARQCLQVSVAMRFMIMQIMNPSSFVIQGPQRKRGASGQIKKPPVEATAWCYTGTRYGWIKRV